MNQIAVIEATIGVLAIALVLGIVALLGLGKAVPAELWTLAGTLIGAILRAAGVVPAPTPTG